MGRSILNKIAPGKAIKRPFKAYTDKFSTNFNISKIDLDLISN